MFGTTPIVLPAVVSRSSATPACGCGQPYYLNWRQWPPLWHWCYILDMATLSDDQIIEIAKEAAAANLASGIWSGAIRNPVSIIDSLGRDGLSITIVLTPGSSSKVTGDMAVTLVFDLNQRLQRAGEDRFSIVRYSSE
jgi:hypothetical protein